MARAWGYWTVEKLDILRRYLDAFTTTTKFKASERIYLDLFAGGPENVGKRTGKPIDSSARIALKIDSPPFTQVHLFELPATAAALEEALRADFPDHPFEVHAGDCNRTLPDVLRQLAPVAWAPTFAFVDPNGWEAEWMTLRAIADFRRSERWKAEMWILFAEPMMTRVLPTSFGHQLQEHLAEEVDRAFGTRAWRAIYETRRSGEWDAARARAEYINLMRWRIETELGYEWTHPLEVCNEQGRPIYYMIFATDHPTGTSIMSDLYATAAAEFPQMRAAARRLTAKQKQEDRGLFPLFNDDADQDLTAPAQLNEKFYEHEPPWEPTFLVEDEDWEDLLGES